MSLSPLPSSSLLNADGRASMAASPAATDDSFIDDVSFEYFLDANDEIVRVSRGSSSTAMSAPTTPEDDHNGSGSKRSSVESQPKAALLHPSTVVVSLNSPVRRISLSRSESAFPILNGASTTTSERDRDRVQSLSTNVRSFHRVASGPVGSSMSGFGAPIASLPRRQRRVTSEEQQEALARKPAEEIRGKLASSSEHYLQLQYPDEKENIIGNGHDVPSVEEIYGPSLSSNIHPGLPSISATSSAGYMSSRNQPPRGAQSNLIASRIMEKSGPQRVRAAATNLISSDGKSVRTLQRANSKNVDRISEVSFEDHVESDTDGYSDTAYESENEPNGLDEYPPTEVLEPHPRSLDPLRSNQRSSSSNALTATQSGGTRSRRSASLSDALGVDEHNDGHAPPREPVESRNREHPRPGTSLGLRREVINPPRRVDIAEKERMNNELRARHSEAELRAPQDSLRPTYTHKRRDSDTLRGSVYSSSGSPTAVEASAIPARISPSAKVLVPSASNLNSAPLKHRRSPTAPEPPTTSNSLNPGGRQGVGRTGAGNERTSRDSFSPTPANGSDVQTERERRSDRGRDRERERPRSNIEEPASTVQSNQIATPAPVSAPTSSSSPPGQADKDKERKTYNIVVGLESGSSEYQSNIWQVNKKAYARLDLIGKGGSSRVFRVMNSASEILAIKRVSLEKTDPETMAGYMNEISLLKRLDGNTRIIRLIDSEVRSSQDGGKGHLLLVMECGEIDLARLLSERAGVGVDMVWIAYYWQQMLQAVQVIHEEKIVHSDLKPANFVLVKGQLKLIDFGIANAIANDTTNIQRDHQIGTVNYMSPEAIELPDGMRRLKVGRPSDVWSLGCILYQMVYGHPPFQHLTVYQKMKAIPDGSYVIEFPKFSAPIKGHVDAPKPVEYAKWKVRGDVIANMKNCLRRNPKERMTIPELLDQDWLAMKELEPKIPPMKELLQSDEVVITSFYMKQLLEYGIKLGRGKTEITPEFIDVEGVRLIKELKTLLNQ